MAAMTAATLPTAFIVRSSVRIGIRKNDNDGTAASLSQLREGAPEAVSQPRRHDDETYRSIDNERIDECGGFPSRFASGGFHASERESPDIVEPSEGNHPHVR
jgi:hypothetical protein